MLIQITAPHFCAGIFDGEPAPILRYMRGWSVDKIQQYCNNKNWDIKIMAQIRGTVQRVTEKPWKNKTLYSFKLNEVWYSTGDKRPPEAGKLIEFDADQNDKGYWNVSKSGIKIVEGGVPVQNVGAAAVAYAPNSQMSKDDYWKRREDRDAARESRIDRAGARNSAISLLDIMTRAGVEALKIPAAAKREEFLLAIVDSYTERFISQNNGENKKNDEPTESQDDASDDSDDSGDNWNV